MDDYLSKPLDPRRLVEALEPRDRAEAGIAGAGAGRGSFARPRDGGRGWHGGARSHPRRGRRRRDRGRPLRDAASANHPPFDLPELLVRCVGDAHLVEKLLGMFPGRVSAAVGAVAACYESRNAPGLAGAAHSIKGSAANLSATAVQRVAEELEALGRAGDVAAADRLVAELRAEADRCVAFIESRKARRPAPGAAV